MIGPIVVTKSSAGEKGLAPGPPPWNLHRNCWKFPYNRECIDDLHGPDGGRNHGHDEGGGRRRKAPVGAGGAETHVLYGNDLWRTDPPAGHDPTWTENGVGLASEFGYGGDGAACVPTPNKPCGWIADDDQDDGRADRSRPPTKEITNGVLGYDEAGVGDPFLKIGVGKLLKGSCRACNATDESAGGYRFNSPYEFAEEPVWRVVKDRRPYHYVLEHEATLGQAGGHGEGEAEGKHHPRHHHNDGPEFGYRLRKSLRVDGRVLSVTSTLTNLGRNRFATPWYSHHLFTCDGIGVGPAGAYGLDLEVRPSTDPRTGRVRYNDSPWAAPISEYADVQAVKHEDEREDTWFDFVSPAGWWRTKETRRTTQITITKEVEEGVKIKAELPNDGGRSRGSFVMHGCGVSVAESIPELHDKIRPSGEAQKSDMTMYAYNVYIERGTLSPEPVYLIELDGGASISWTQRVEIGLDGAEVAKMTSSWNKNGVVENSRAGLLDGNGGRMGPLTALFFTCIALISYSAIQDKRRRRRRSEGYRQLPSVLNV